MTKKMNELTHPFEIYVRQYCVDQNITIQELARQTGLARSTFYALLKPTNNPKLASIVALANVIKVHPQTLLNLKWQDFDLVCPELPTSEQG